MKEYTPRHVEYQFLQDVLAQINVFEKVQHGRCFRRLATFEGCLVQELMPSEAHNGVDLGNIFEGCLMRNAYFGS